MSTDEHDWEEDFKHENGMYQNKCCKCHVLFLGHKRRGLCKVCYNKSTEEWNSLTDDEKESVLQKAANYIKEFMAKDEVH